MLVFARTPLPGRVKTRLVPRLGEWGAARLHARLTARALRTARAARCGPVEVYGSPRQRGADLGERMYRALSQALRRHRAVAARAVRLAGARVEHAQVVRDLGDDAGFFE